VCCPRKWGMIGPMLTDCRMKYGPDQRKRLCGLSRNQNQEAVGQGWGPLLNKDKTAEIPREAEARFIERDLTGDGLLFSCSPKTPRRRRL